MKYRGPERRKLLNIREMVEFGGTAGQAEMKAYMARMLGPDRLQRIDEGLPERRGFMNLRGLIDEVDGPSRRICKGKIAELTREVSRNKLKRIDAKIDDVFRPGMVLRGGDSYDMEQGIRELLCAANIISPKAVRRYSKMVADPEELMKRIDYLCGMTHTK